MRDGQFIDDMLQEFIEQSLKKLPIPRPMRWGDSDIEFVRPIHWVLRFIWITRHPLHNQRACC